MTKNKRSRTIFSRAANATLARRAILMASTAIVGFVPGAAFAQERIVDGVEETIDTDQTFDALTVGDTQPGSVLTITGGADVDVDGDGIIGNQVGSDGTLTISGSSLSTGDDLVVGAYGAGDMTVTDGATVVASSIDLGRRDSGSGTLTISNGGQVTANNSTQIGTYGSGYVTVSGAGSSLRSATYIDVGYEGTGTLDVLDGATVSAGQVFLGFSEGVSGTVTVSGAGSRLASDANMYLGNSGTGILDVSDGGRVEAGGTVNIGYSIGGTGTVTVSGTGALQSGGTILIGYNGEGDLSVSSGGQVSSGSGISLGVNDGSVGTVTVSGAGSSVSASGSVYVGYSGTGTLDVNDGASVDADAVVFVGFDGGTGTVTVSGAGSKLTSAYGVYIGGADGLAGDGTITVSNGGILEAGSYVSIGSILGSSGTLNIGAAAGETAVAAGNVQGADGEAATIFFNGGGQIVFNHTDTDLDFDGNISGTGDVFAYSGTTTLSGLNNIGQGDLTVEGGEVIVANQMEAYNAVAGREAGANGTITISGAAGALVADENITIGGYGAGALNVTDGGSVNADFVVAGVRDGGTGTVTVSGSGSTVSVGSVIMGALEGSAGSLDVSAGANVTTNFDVILGYYAGSEGTATISGAGSSLSAGGGLSVGAYGEGDMTVTDGATVDASNIDLGRYGSGSGTLTISNGGRVTANNSTQVGTGGTGYATVSGAGSTLTSGSFFHVGADGEGTLEVLDGATVSANEVYLGYYSAGSGTVTVSGAGSHLTSDAGMFLGKAGTGVIDVSDGGQVSSGDAIFIGTNTASLGAVTVSGSGSSMTADSFISVGNDGAGTLTVSDGGVVEAGTGFEIADYDGSTGTLNIGAAAGEAAVAAGNVQGTDGAAADIVFGSGDGEIVFNHSDTNLGFNANVSGNGDIFAFAGTTTLSGAIDIGGDLVVDGDETIITGTTSAGNVFAGQAAGSNGTITVSGAGSQLNASQKVYVGFEGTGTLNVIDGGTVDNDDDDIVVGNSAGSTGTVTVSGSGSSLSAGDNLVVGAYGEGDMTVTEGATVEASFIDIGYSEGGSGTLTISNGGQVTSSSGTQIGTYGSGYVTVSGAGSSLTSGTYIDVGTVGAGTLDVLDGATVSADEVYLGFDTAGSGTVTVSGAGSRPSSGNMYLGNSGTGILDVSDGGSVEAGGHAYIGVDSGATGTVAISGAGSSLVSNQTTYVGIDGTGTLTVSDGGVAEAGTGFEIARHGGSVGTLNIGAAAGETAVAAGNVQGADGAAADIVFGSGDGQIVFNHTDTDLDFNADISGDGDIFAYSGTTTLSGLNNIGQGDLTVEGGEVIVANQMEAYNAVAGQEAGANGTITVSGAAGALVADESITVGGYGTGALNVSAGATVTTNSDVTLGYYAGSEGTATISGVGSLLSAGGELSVGVYGTGDMTVTGGATVEASFIDLGYSEDGSGTLTISNGGQATASGGTQIGTYGSGYVTVSGAGSRLASDADMSIGNSGTGILDVSDGGRVEAGGAVNIGYSIGGTGTVTVSGAGSLQSGDTILIGAGGEGGLSVSSGGQVSSGNGISLGVNDGSAGTVAVTGAGSSMTADSFISVGINGTGTLNVLDGGNVTSAGSIFVGEQNGATGTATASGAGSSITAAGDIHVGNNGSSGTLTLSEGGVAEAGTDIRIADDLESTGMVTVSGAGLRLSAAGEILVGADGTGTLVLTDGGVAEASANTIIIAQSEGSTGALVIGAVSGQGPASAGYAQSTDSSTANIVFGSGAGELVFNHNEADYVFDDTVSGNGAISHEAGFTSLTGDFSGFTGVATVSGGTLSVDTFVGGDVDVANSGTLTGSGTVGDVDFAAGSSYSVNPYAQTSLTSTGTVTIDADAQFVLDPEPTVITDIFGQRTILTAQSIVGEFSEDLASDLLFLTLGLEYAPTSIVMDLQRNDTAFADVAFTRNQRASATALDALPEDNDLSSAIVQLSDADVARHVFDLVSGDAHASIQGSLIQSSGDVRAIVSGQVNEAFDGFGMRAMSGGPDEGQPDRRAWAKAYGSFARMDGDAEAGDVDHDTGGMLAGLETDGFRSVRAGVFAGYGQSSTSVSSRGADADISSFTLGGYAAREFGAWRTQLGAAFTTTSVETTRDIEFSFISEQETADYNSNTAQLFGEVGYQLPMAKAKVQPFAALAIVNQQTDAFTEKGGSAALDVNIASQTIGISTLGLRTNGVLAPLENGAVLSYKGTLAWEHAMGDVVPEMRAGLSGAAAPFGVTGMPVSADTGVVETGMTLNFLSGANLSLSYRGQFGGKLQDNAITAGVALRF